MLGSGKPKTGRAKKYTERSNREKQLCIRISETDLKMLNRICKKYGVTKTDFLIGCIREKA